LIVVSDTSPILNLARIRRLDLLPSLYVHVLIPPSVSLELTGIKDDISSLVEHALQSWLMVASPKDQELVNRLRSGLDAGEAEAIVLAVERGAHRLLIDERLGRRVAKTFGLHITGLLGVLAEAKRARLLEGVKPLLDQLITDARFWIAPDLYREVLTVLDEA
jgi:predicted nucleic acid-binding protein